MAVKVTEKEVASGISEIINKLITKGGYPFETSSVEPQLTGTTPRFIDIVLWNDRKTADAFCIIELKIPGKKENIQRLEEVTEKLNCKYALTWNFDVAVLFYKNNQFTEKKYYSTYVISHIEEWLQIDKQIKIKKYLEKFLDDLSDLKVKGSTHRFPPDKFFFINLLNKISKELQPHFKAHLKIKLRDKSLKDAFEAFWTAQGIPSPDNEESVELLTQQWVYGLLSRLLFYSIIRKQQPDLPDLIKISEECGQLDKEIFKAFEKARLIDWQAVFDPEYKMDEIGIPASGLPVLRELLAKLKDYDFGNLKEDVVGEIFEGLIPDTQKHKLGQYFTREDLVDLIIGFTIKSANGYYSDPTCGSGTFLNRIYSRINWLSQYKKKHTKILEQVWGFDIAKFPAELATINLFRQDISDYRNFPRVQNVDFFEVYPGREFKFPPPKASEGNFDKIDIKVPGFDAMVGNFPFIRQELLEKKEKGNKKRITTQIANDWFSDYSDIFDTKFNDRQIEEIKKKSGKMYFDELKSLIDSGKIGLKLSGQADIYAYLFIHSAKFIPIGGRMGFITSNSFLDVSYGYALKKFFLDKFKIVAVVASWCEPWFHFASVNTVFTILERCDDKKERDNNTVRFVKINKRLDSLIEFRDLEFEESERWKCINQIVDKIENTSLKKDQKDKVISFEDDDMRIRLINQERLLAETELEGSNSKWGKYIRAPQVYFDILEKAGSKLLNLNKIADIRRGYTTGINDFFYLEPTGEKPKNSKCLSVTNKRGWTGEIEKQFLKSIIKSPKEADRVMIDPAKLKFLLFMCNMPKSDLKKRGFTCALKYINWGEKQKTPQGVSWPSVSSVKSRKDWWSLGERTPFPLFMQMVNNDRFVTFFNTGNTLADHNLFELNIDSVPKVEMCTALMNSSLTALSREVVSRINLGDGATKTEGVDWKNNVHIFDPAQFNKTQCKNILKAFEKIKNRKIKPIAEEVKLKDRREFDTAILKAIGLDPKLYLDKIYDGLVQIVSERLALPKMRKKISKSKKAISTKEIKATVENELLSDGLKPFPDLFIPKLKKNQNIEISTSGQPLKLGPHFFGNYEVLDSENKLIYEAKSLKMAVYIICAYTPGEFIITIPTNDILIAKAVTKYQKYIKATFKELGGRLLSATHDHDLAGKIANELLEQYGYSGNFNLTW